MHSMCIRKMMFVFELFIIIDETHKMGKRKSFVFARQYRSCSSQRINALVSRNQSIKTAVGIVMQDFDGLKTMTFHRVADIAYSDLTVTEIIQLFHAM